ncbi:MAG: leuD, partial [Deltaproteobacteria bacterium]|nr:leuD [Deltaproteobacteria bacterium]
SSPWEERRAAILRARPEFVTRVQPGDLIVAGRNFGCGSSREHAPENLKLLGLGGVLAESFGRIYFRNCVAIAFPNLACPGIHAACADGDEVEFDVRTGLARNHTRGIELSAPPWTPDMVEILAQGGLLEVLRRRVEAARTAAPR